MNANVPWGANQAAAVELPISQTMGSVVNIHGGNFMHIGGDYHHHTSQFTTQLDGQGLNTLIQHTAPDAMHNSAERYPPPKCHQKTRNNILTELTDWIEHPQKEDFPVLWLHAPAGHGKSAILQPIAELLTSPKGRVVANFFFGRGKGKREQARYLFPTIAYQLALNVPGLRSHVDQMMRDDPTLPRTALKFQVESLIVDAFARLEVSDAPKFPFTVIIDGLDECSDPEAQKLIIELVERMTTIKCPPLRFLIASRPEPHIYEVFNRRSLRELTWRVTLNDDFTSRLDIRVFLRDGFSDIYNRKSHLIGHVKGTWPSEKAINFMCAKSSGQFIYAATVLRFIDDRFELPGRQLDIILSQKSHRNNAFSDLDALYLQILSTYHEPDMLIRLLGFVVVMPRQELAAVYEDLLDLNSGEVELILQGMHSLLDGCTKGKGISIPHASFRDFLTDKTRSGKYYIDAQQFNGEVVAAAFSLVSRCMLGTIRICSQRLPGPSTLAFLFLPVRSSIRRLEVMPQSVMDEIFDLEINFQKYGFRHGVPFKTYLAILSPILNAAFQESNNGITKIPEKGPRTKLHEELEDLCDRYLDLFCPSFHALVTGSRNHPLRTTPGILAVESSSVAMLSDLFMLETNVVKKYMDDVKVYNNLGLRCGFSIHDFLNVEDKARDLYHSEDSRHTDVCRHFILRFFGKKWSEIREPSNEVLLYLLQQSSSHFDKSGWGDDILRLLEDIKIPDSDPAGVSLHKTYCIWTVVKIFLRFLANSVSVCDNRDMKKRLQKIQDGIFRQILCVTVKFAMQEIHVVSIREPFLTAESNLELFQQITSRFFKSESHLKRAMPQLLSPLQPIRSAKRQLLTSPSTTDLKSRISSQFVSDSPPDGISDDLWRMDDPHDLPFGFKTFLTQSRRAGNLYIPTSHYSASVFTDVRDYRKL